MRISLSDYQYWYPSFFKAIFPGSTVEPYTNVEDTDLVVFTGGADISPSIYGEKNYASNVNPPRDTWETQVFDETVGKIPQIGICRGHQFLNAMYGGKLVQDIKERHSYIHEITTVYGSSLYVNSTHHQAVIETPLEHLAYHKDGTIEMAYGEKVLTMQFHPEQYRNPSLVEFLAKRFMILLEV